MHKLVSNGHFCRGSPKLEGNKIFCPTLYVIIVHSPNPTFMPSLSEIGDLISVTSCLVFSWHATAWERRTRRAEEGERSEKDHESERGVQALCLPKSLAFFSLLSADTQLPNYWTKSTAVPAFNTRNVARSAFSLSAVCSCSATFDVSLL